MIIPKFSLQPLIENAVHHGLRNEDKTDRYRVEAREENNMIFILVKDNGQGITKERLKEIRETLNQSDMQETEHIGLNNINIRLKLLYGKEYGLSIDSEEEKRNDSYASIAGMDRNDGGKECIRLYWWMMKN